MTRYATLKGLLLAVTAAVFYSAHIAIVQKLDNVSSTQLFFYRSSSLVATTLPHAIHSGKPLLGLANSRTTLVFSGIFNSIYQYFSIVAFLHLPAGVAAVIISSSLVTTAVGDKLIMKEPCHGMQMFTALLVVIGILLTSPFPAMLTGTHAVSLSGHNYWVGFAAGIGTMLANSARFLCFRTLRTTHHAVVIFNTNIVSTIAAILVVVLTSGFGALECGLQQLLIICMGGVLYISTTALIKGFQYENATLINTVTAAVEIIVSFFFQMLIFHKFPDGYGIAGAVLVCISITFISIDKYNS